MINMPTGISNTHTQGSSSKGYIHKVRRTLVRRVDGLEKKRARKQKHVQNPNKKYNETYEVDLRTL
jgi:hypothetical protein